MTTQELASLRDEVVADLCDRLTPTTLAAIVADLSTESGYPINRVRQLVRQALEANVGDDEAAAMISKCQ